LLDHVVEWSTQDGLYVILDLLAAPGGQTGANIGDSYGYPWLYDSLKERAIAMWQRLARHHNDNPTVLGYDLLNRADSALSALRPLNVIA
jgi:endoglucanase